MPQNLGIMLGALPAVAPDIKPDTLGFVPRRHCAPPGAQRGLFDPDCPLVLPIDIGTSILLSAPGLLLALFAFRRTPGVRLTLGGGVAVIAIARVQPRPLQPGLGPVRLPVLLDFIPFLLPLVALGAAGADGAPG